MPSIHAESFNSLPSVQQELAEINQMFGGVKLADAQFQRRAFASQFQGDTFTIVHIASHGLFKGSAKDTFVLTYDGKLYLNDLEKLIQPSQFRGDPVELLTLSACQTAAGEDASRAALGLAGVAIKAGARSALASLWSVNDVASARLIGAFYGQLQSNASTTKAEALRRAQLELLRVPATRHPRYWAPYLIIGNWK
jgi:CHAT domain-containing protein